LVGGVSLASYATETPVGPTIEKAQLETVDINLDEVVAAITKADPDWVKGLPKLKEVKLGNDGQFLVDHYYEFEGSDDTIGELKEPANWNYRGTSPSAITCDGETDVICGVRLPVDEDGLEDYLDTLVDGQLQSENRIESFREE